METRSGTVYVATIEVEPEWEDELNRWYDQEHVPNLLKVPGYRSGRRYVAVEGEPKYMAIYEIDSIDAWRSPEHEQAVKTPWTARLHPHYRSQLGFYEQVNPAEGLMRGPAWEHGAAGERGLMMIRIDVDRPDEQDFNDWYDQEHLAALCSVPGVIGARRFRAIQGGPKYMAIYHLTSPEVQGSDAWKQAIDTPWSEQVRKTFRNRWRAVYRPHQVMATV